MEMPTQAAFAGFGGFLEHLKSLMPRLGQKVVYYEPRKKVTRGTIVKTRKWSVWIELEDGRTINCPEQNQSKRNYSGTWRYLEQHGK